MFKIIYNKPNSTENFVVSHEELDKAVEMIKNQLKTSQFDLNNDGKIDKKDFSKASKTLNKAKKIKNNKE